MHAPECSDHGRLVLDLALGALDGAEADRAETVRHECPNCRAWWRDRLEGEAAAAVDAAVAEALVSVDLPRRRRHVGLVAAAAAAVMALGVASLWLAQRPVAGPTVPERTAVIRTLGFEDPDQVAPLMHSAPQPEPIADAPAVEAAPVRVAEAVETSAAERVVETPEPVADELLSADGFESGDLSGWDPQA